MLTKWALRIGLLALAVPASCARNEGPAAGAGAERTASGAGEGQSSGSGAGEAGIELGDEAVDRSLAELGFYGGAAARSAMAAGDCPGADDEAALIGTRAAEWRLESWTNTDEALSLKGLRGRVVVVRFWTAPSCPYCEKTLPALQGLAEELEGREVMFVGAFHAKPAGSMSMEEAAEVARGWGVTFPLALDPSWVTLRKWWVETGHRHASSATFVIGKDGRIVHVHPGPVFYPSDDPGSSDEHRDYEQVRRAIEVALADS